MRLLSLQDKQIYALGKFGTDHNFQNEIDQISISRPSFPFSHTCYLLINKNGLQ